LRDQVPATAEPSEPPRCHTREEHLRMMNGEMAGACGSAPQVAGRCEGCGEWVTPDPALGNGHDNGKLEMCGPITGFAPAERVVGEAGTVEKLTPLAREVFPMAAAIEAGTVGGKHAYQAGIYEAYYEDVCVICDQPASDPCHDPVHEVGR
jgi:hypothetical protein